MAGNQCCENAPTLSSSYGDNSGSVKEIGGLKTYVTGSSESKLAILLISDLFGYEAPKLRKLADKVAAKAGFYVVVPDFFHGDLFTTGNSNRTLEDWIKIHGQDKGFEEAKAVIASLKDKGFSAIGAAAEVVIELGKFDYIQAAVLLHPPRVVVDDFKGVKAPVAVLGAEIDSVSPPALLKTI